MTRTTNPPNTRKGDDTDVFHGVTVADPYRWLEDPNAPEVQAWVEEQNAQTFAFLDAIPGRPRLAARLTELMDYQRTGVPFTENGRIFVFRNTGLQNQAVLWTSRQGDPEPERVLLDPNTLSSDGTVALGGCASTRDGRLLAYGLSASGSDWHEWRVRDVDRGEDLPDRINWVRFSGVSWTRDGVGFYYSRYDEPPPGEAHTAVALHQKLCFHRLGTAQRDDVIVYQRPDQPEWGFGGGVSDDGDYLTISVWHGTDPRNRVYLQDLRSGGPIVEVLPDADASYQIIGNVGRRFFVHTDLDAPRGRVVEIDLDRPERASWTTLIPEAAHALMGVSLIGGRFFASYLAHACTEIRQHALDGAPLGAVALPGLGTVSGFAGRPDDHETYYAYTGFTTPTRIYRYDVPAGTSTLHFAPALKFDPDAYETRQIFYPSKDGTRIPMFLVHKKGLVADGNNPTYLYGYGGFNIPLTPVYDPGRVLWLEQGGLLAVANLRGGGEYGEEWHQAGCRLKRQNVFDDFIAGAEHVISTGLTRPARLAIAGGSNGGLLVGACLTQRPELFGAALPDVGVLDMLRFHKFTIGWAWISDYGSPDDPEEFKVLLGYSPLHNTRAGTAYPATLITTADTDDRVVSAHSYKFAAALQAAQAGDAPILLRVDVRAGHGAGKPTTKVIASTADRTAFLTRVFGMEQP